MENPAQGVWAGPDFTVTAIASKEKVEKNKSASSEDQHFSIRTERYRYIRCRNGEEELYDHKKDPHEWTNVASYPEMKSVLQSMRERLKLAGVEFSI
jgi:iduronate 2-sulfatase